MARRAGAVLTPLAAICLAGPAAAACPDDTPSEMWCGAGPGQPEYKCGEIMLTPTEVEVGESTTIDLTCLFSGPDGPPESAVLDIAPEGGDYTGTVRAGTDPGSYLVTFSCRGKELGARLTVR